MFCCYIDESGCPGTIATSTSDVQPVFVIAGIIIQENFLGPLTVDFLNLKRRFFPDRPEKLITFLDWILIEIKGSEVRKQIRHHRIKENRHGIGFLDNIMDLFEKYDVRILGKLYVKQIGAENNPTSMYTSSIQSVCETFQRFLDEEQSQGILILDSRKKYQNQIVSHSIFTQKFKSSGDGFGNIIEMPVFGHSDNHAGIQLADLLCSAFLFPMACYAYCSGTVASVHVDEKYSVLQSRYGHRLKDLQFCYRDAINYWRGGISVSDGLTKRSGGVLFKPPENK